MADSGNIDVLAYETHGEPTLPTVIFLHGFMGSRRDWRATAMGLSDAHHCVLVDLPGHGESALKPDSGFAQFSSQLHALIAPRLAVTLVGYSMGGRLALHFACTYPSLVSRLIVESATPGLRTDDERSARVCHDEALARRLESEPFTEFLAAWYQQPLFASLTGDEARLTALLADRLINDPKRLASVLRQFGTGRQPNLWPVLATLTCPVDFVVGALDPKYVAIANTAAGLRPDIVTHVFGDCGHNAHREAPLRFNRLCQTILGDG